MRDLLIKARESRKMTQSDLAKELNTSQQNISLLENGKRNPNLVLAKRFENYFGMPMEKLFPDIFLSA